MSSHEANNRPQTVEKDGEFALKLHTAKNRGKGRGDRPKLRRKHLYFSNLLSGCPPRLWVRALDMVIQRSPVDGFNSSVNLFSLFRVIRP